MTNVLRKTKEFAEQNGLGYGELYSDTTGQYCMIGAIAHNMGVEDNVMRRNAYSIVGNSREGKVLTRVIKENYPEYAEYNGSETTIWAFNDDYKDTPEVRIAMLDKAAVEFDQPVFDEE